MPESFLPAAGLAADPHSHAGASPVRVRHLALDLVVDFDRRELTGTATWQLANPGAGDEIVFDVRDLAIAAVETVNGAGAQAPAAYTLGPTDPVLGQALRVRLAPGSAEIGRAHV